MRRAQYVRGVFGKFLRGTNHQCRFILTVTNTGVKVRRIQQERRHGNIIGIASQATFEHVGTAARGFHARFWLNLGKLWESASD